MPVSTSIVPRLHSLQGKGLARTDFLVVWTNNYITLLHMTVLPISDIRTVWGERYIKFCLEKNLPENTMCNYQVTWLQIQHNQERTFSRRGWVWGRDTCMGALFGITGYYKNIQVHTRGGPIIIPFQRVKVISSSSSRPQLIVPSPPPFWPSSSSSRRRKLRGTGREIILLFFYQLHTINLPT